MALSRILKNGEKTAPIFSWPCAVSLEPRALKHEPWALRHEPWTINHWQSINQWIIRLLIIRISLVSNSTWQTENTTAEYPGCLKGERLFTVAHRSFKTKATPLVATCSTGTDCSLILVQSRCGRPVIIDHWRNPLMNCRACWSILVIDCALVSAISAHSWSSTIKADRRWSLMVGAKNKWLSISLSGVSAQGWVRNAPRNH